MLVVVLAVIGGTAGLGYAVGLGNASVLAALTALFCLIAAVGGPLRADLRLLAKFAPALVVAVGVPRLLGAVSHWAAIALLAVIVFVAGLLPALGSRYVTVGMGLGMASVFGYGFQLTGAASAGQIIGAPALAAGVGVLLRLLMGARDPGKPTRQALADALTDADPAVAGRAATLWLNDRPERWTGRVAGGLLRYHAATAVLEGRRGALPVPATEEVGATLEAARAEADRLAGAVRAKSIVDEVKPVGRRASATALPGSTGRLIEVLWTALEQIREAALGRDRSKVDIPAGLRRELLRTSLRGAFCWRSAQLRHAVRGTLGMVLALVVAGLRPGDPLTVSFLMTVYAIMQPEWQDTLSRAWQRIAGSLGGAVVLALAIWLLPPAALLPLGIAAVLAGFPFLRTKPMIFNGCMVLMSVSVNAGKQHLDPGYLLVEYLLLMLLAAMIGLLFGFAAVPGVPKPALPERFAEAVGTMRELLTGFAALLRGDGPDQRELGLELRAAARARQDLANAEPGSAEPTGRQRAAVDDAVDGLRGLAGAMTAALLRGRHDPVLAAAVEEVALALESGADPDLNLQATAGDEERELLLDTMAADVVRLNRAAAVLR